MSKNLQKVLAGSLATLSTLSIATPVIASNVDVDALYKNAYEATLKAQETEKQSDINAAMELIWQLRHVGDEKKDANLINAACTWSSLVDKVQHPKLVKIVDAITKAQKTEKQAYINAAFATIESDLPEVWRNSYSSAIDEVQQKLQVKLVAAVEKAEADKTKKSVEDARAIVNEVLTANNKAVVEWAKIFEARLNAVVIGDSDDIVVKELIITDVAEVTNSYVEVNFKSLSENINDATLNVVDNKGNKVSVVTQTLLKGQTTAKFNFHNYVSGKLSGVWTVNGIKVNLTERAFLEDINSQMTVQKLSKILLWDYKDLVVENNVDVKIYNLDKYVQEINKKLNSGERFKTIKEVKDLIDKVNEEVKAKMDKGSYVETVKNIAKDSKATTEQFSNVLQLGVDLGYIKNVDGNLMGAYHQAISRVADQLNKFNPDTSIDIIQKCINNIEKTQVENAKNELKNALAKTDKDALLKALKNPLLGLDNVKDTNIDHYFMDRVEINKLVDTNDLTKVNDYIKALNSKADVVNAKNVNDMLAALKDYSQYKNITVFNNLSSQNQQDVAEELLRVSYKDGKLTLTDKNSATIKTEVKTAVQKVKDNIGELNQALKFRKDNIKTSQDTTTGIRRALAKITGQETGEISVDQAIKLYENSLEKHHGEETLKTYTNYTEVKAALK